MLKLKAPSRIKSPKTNRRVPHQSTTPDTHTHSTDTSPRQTKGRKKKRKGGCRSSFVRGGCVHNNTLRRALWRQHTTRDTLSIRLRQSEPALPKTAIASNKQQGSAFPLDVAQCWRAV